MSASALAKLSISPDVDSDSGVDCDSDSGGDCDSGSIDETSDGIMLYPRSDIPKKDFDFSDVPMFSRSEFATYAFYDTYYIVPWCGPNSQPLKPEHLKEIKSDANFILLTDSAETFVNLFNNHCHIRHKFFLVKGTADEVTCYFLRLLKREWRIPIVALVDYDPMSLKLLSFYETWTPKGMSWCFSGVDLDIKWLGIRNIHLDIAEDPLNAEVIKSRSFVEMDDEDLAIAKSLLNDNFVKKSEERVAEVKRMIDHKLMTILIALHVDFVVETYLPALLNNKRWI